MFNLTLENLLISNRFIPVVILNDETKAIPLAKSLLAGGVKTMEITLRAPNALKIIEKITNELPEMVVGAGTILNTEQYHHAITHGAKFIVSPGLTNNLIDISKDYNIPFLPGAITPSEIINAIDAGFQYLKFFPADSFNGLNTLKAYASVFSSVKFCPTGGINQANIIEYIKLKNVIAIGCSFLADSNLVDKNDFTAITQIAIKTQNLI